MKLDNVPDRSRPDSSRPSRMQSINTHGTTFLGMLHTLDSRRRMGFSAMFGMVFFLCLPNSMHLDSRILAGWISSVICFIGLVLLMMSYASPLKTRYLAQRQEAQHWVIFLLVVSTALTSIFAIALMLANNSKDALTFQKTIHIGLSAIAILCSWVLTHIMFTLHYATCYYREDEFNQEADYAGGLAFPTEEMLDYFDFMYFSFTIGMTSQTSDVSITSRFMRRLALSHGFVSFLFYSVIISLTIGVIGGLI